MPLEADPSPPEETDRRLVARAILWLKTGAILFVPAIAIQPQGPVQIHDWFGAVMLVGTLGCLGACWMDSSWWHADRMIGLLNAALLAHAMTWFMVLLVEHRIVPVMDRSDLLHCTMMRLTVVEAGWPFSWLTAVWFSYTIDVWPHMACVGSYAVAAASALWLTRRFWHGWRLRILHLSCVAMYMGAAAGVWARLQTGP